LKRATWPLAAALLVAPVAVVLQNRVIAPLALLAFTGAVLLGWRAGWRPKLALTGPALPAALLLLWMGVASLWSVEPLRGWDTALRLAALLGLAWLAGQAVRGAPGAWWAAPIGVALGIAAAGFDMVSDHALRAAVRGLAEAPPTLAFGLKNAAAVLALLLPIGLVALRSTAAAVPLALAAAGVILILPGESAKLAVLAALLVMPLAALWPRLVPRAIGAALALAILAGPWALQATLRQGFDASAWPYSAAHRLMIWDFVVSEIAERPILGHGMEASRAIPGGRDHPSPGTLARFRLPTDPAASWLPSSELLPLHPHNAALQIWLELGLIGALLGAWLALALGAAAARSPSPAAAAGSLVGGGIIAMLSYGAWQHWWVAALALAAVSLSLTWRDDRIP
jgi:O-antigen ligase